MNQTQKNRAMAEAEGRICANCKRYIPKADFRRRDKVHYCPDCKDALKGVNVRGGYYPYKDEPTDLTGEM